MRKLLGLHVNFIFRSTRKNKEGLSPIVLRIIYHGERRDVHTGLHCDQESWDSEIARIKKASKRFASVNDQLDDIHRRVLEVFEELRYRTSDFTIDELIERIKGKGEMPVLLIDYLENQKTEIGKRVGVDISSATSEKYRRSASHVQNFLLTEFKVKNYPLIRIDSTFLEKYFQHLRVSRGIQNNTAVKYITFLKTVLMPALKSGLIPTDPFKNVKFRQKTVHKGFLTQEEIDNLANVELSKDLSRTRDVFLFSCYTGLAYIDIKQLSRTHIIKDQDDSFYIRKPRQKTGQESIIPLLPPAIRILMKYTPTEDFRDFKWKVSSNQKMNMRLKDVGEKAGICKPLHMHLARHTFATTVTLSNGVPLETVSNMLGHATLKQTQHYAKIIGIKVKSDMKRLVGIFK